MHDRSLPSPPGYLLDTSVALKWQSDSNHLRPEVRELIADSNVRLVFSLASLAEIRIKMEAGHLTVDKKFFDCVSGGAIELMPMSAQHTMAIGDLTPHHKDPFDLMLIAQAISEDLTIITENPHFSKYPCRIMAAVSAA